MIKDKGTNLLAKGIDLAKIDFPSILSKFHDGVLITDKHGVILYYNTSMGKVDDIEPDDAIGKRVLEIYALSERQSPTMRCLASQQAIINDPLFYRTHLGKVTNAFLNVYPLFNDNMLVGSICFVSEYHMVEKRISTPRPNATYESERKNGTRFSFADIIGRRTDLSESVRIAQMAAESPSPILIAGETGTGKELFAQAIHNFSTSSKNRFVPINCAAIPENLLEGILFGTSTGAFTGSIEKAGLFEQANGGTLFLDELNSMPISLQTKLLRVIQEKKVRRIGAHNEVSLNMKIISSINQDPHEEINKGNLRLDLFYRLGVVFVKLPTLKERNRDHLKLTNHFIDKFNSKLKKHVSGISPQVQEFFSHYHWPGNVRELEHVIEGAMNLVGREQLIEESHLPQHFLRSISTLDTHNKKETSSTDTSFPISTESLKEQSHKEVDNIQQSLRKLNEEHRVAEKKIIHNALTSTKGNIAQAVRILGLSSPQTLQYKMKKLNLHRSDFLGKDITTT